MNTSASMEPPTLEQLHAKQNRVLGIIPHVQRMTNQKLWDHLMDLHKAEFDRLDRWSRQIGEEPFIRKPKASMRYLEVAEDLWEQIYAAAARILQNRREKRDRRLAKRAPQKGLFDD